MRIELIHSILFVFIINRHIIIIKMNIERKVIYMAYFLATGSPQNSSIDTPTEEGVVELPDTNWDVDGEVLVCKDTVVNETVVA